MGFMRENKMISIKLLKRFTCTSFRLGPPFGLCVLILALLLPGRTAMAWTVLGTPGEWTNPTFNSDNPPFQWNKVSPPGTPGGADWFTNTLHVASSGGDITNGTFQFKLRAEHSWTFNWGGGATANIDNTTSMTSGGGNETITLNNNSYYSFRTLNPPTNGTAVIGIMKTSALPVSVARASQVPAAPHSGDTVTINITLGAAKSAEEHVYVRWTTNNFATTTYVEATGSGTSYSANIPPMPNGRQVIYYILSSTATTGGALNDSTADYLTLNLDSNGGVNYTYTPANILWPGFGYPSDPAGNIHHWKEEAVIGNGYINVMLDQNGALYDIYYPSVGARHGVGPSNEGYRGPEQFPDCPSLDAEANGQMNAIACQGGIGIDTGGGTNSIFWLQNADGTDYVSVGQRWDSDSVNVVATSNTLVALGNNIQVMQYDFCPSTNALPVVTDGTRTNYGVYVKRFLLTNNQATTNTVDFYYDANFNINGGNDFDTMLYTNNTMIAYDNTYRAAPLTNSCYADGYTHEYSPSFAFPYVKSNSLYFATAMKLVTNSVTGTGLPPDGSWRDYTSTDNQEGWVGKHLTLAPGATTEVDVMVVGSWDDIAGATGTHNFWGVPLVNWFYTNSMASCQAATETYWSNWLTGGVTVNLPTAAYNTLFKRSLLITALHCDAATGAIMAGMHNGAYPFVWPRDGVYAAITLDRTGHIPEAANFYHWLRDVAYRNADANPGGKSFFMQKYNTDGYFVWTSAQMDETASVPWGMYYHYLVTGDGNFVTNYWQMARQSAYACYYGSTNDANAYYDFANNLMHGESVWEDASDDFIYSNGSIVRGLRDAANLATIVGSVSEVGTFNTQAGIIVGGITNRINARVEPSDISHLGLTVPYEVFAPNDPLMTNVVEWLNGRQAAGTCSQCISSGGPWFDNIVEHDAVNYPDIVGLVNRYGHNVNGSSDTYWNTSPGTYMHSPWFLATSWYGEYFARWQDYAPGTTMIDTNKYLLDLLINKLGPMGLASEQIAPTTGLQKYPGFWLQTAWPNTWESHSTLVDQMMMFLDYKPAGTNGNNTCYFAPKLPSAWSTMTFNNLYSQGQRFNITVSAGPGGSASYTRADINKLTSGSLNYDLWLRIPAGQVPVMIVTNGAYYVPSPANYDITTGRVHIQGPMTGVSGANFVVVTYGNDSYENDGLPDYWQIQYGLNPLDNGSINPNNGPNGDPDGDGMSNLQEYLAGTDPTNSTSYLHIISVKPQGNDVVVTWTTGGGKTNMLQYAPGAGDGSYSNNYVDIPPQIILPGNLTTIITNQIDQGGATNIPSRYYRVRLVP